MSATFASIDRIDKRDLLECSRILEGNSNFPAVVDLLIDFFFIFQEQIEILFKPFDLHFLFVEVHVDCFWWASSQIINSSFKQSEYIIVQFFQTKTLKVRFKLYRSVILTLELADLRLIHFAHIVLKNLLIKFLCFWVSTLNLKFAGENISQFGAKSVSTSGDLSDSVIIVATCE